jgi:hypothetical protein
MLFVMVLKAHPETLHMRTIRRLHWEYPESLKIVGEYWLESDDPSAIVGAIVGAIVVLEAESMSMLSACTMAWEDVMYIEVFQAITAEQGLEALRQKMLHSQKLPS